MSSMEEHREKSFLPIIHILRLKIPFLPSSFALSNSFFPHYFHSLLSLWSGAFLPSEEEGSEWREEVRMLQIIELLLPNNEESIFNPLRSINVPVYGLPLYSQLTRFIWFMLKMHFSKLESPFGGLIEFRIRIAWNQDIIQTLDFLRIGFLPKCSGWQCLIMGFISCELSSPRAG